MTRRLRSRGDVRRMLLARGWNEPPGPGGGAVGGVRDPRDRVTWYDVADGESTLVGGGPTRPDGGRTGWEVKFFQGTPAGVIVAACTAIAASKVAAR